MIDPYFSAIVRWREQLDQMGGGLAAFEQSATVSTMLFGCRRWIETKAGVAAAGDVERIQHIRDELEHWLEKRGLTFTG